MQTSFFQSVHFNPLFYIDPVFIKFIFSLFLISEQNFIHSHVRIIKIFPKKYTNFNLQKDFFLSRKKNGWRNIVKNKNSSLFHTSQLIGVTWKMYTICQNGLRNILLLTVSELGKHALHISKIYIFALLEFHNDSALN